jgi:hypothetical protein
LSKYQYLGNVERVYPDVVIPGEGSLVAKPGLIQEFDKPPTDGLWVKITEPKVKAVKEAEESK